MEDIKIEPKEESLNETLEIEESMKMEEVNIEPDEENLTETLDSGKSTFLDKLKEKTRRRYLLVYEEFMKWKQIQNIENINEDVIFKYIEEMSQVKVPPSLWSAFSMLRSTILSKNDNIDIAKYKKVTAFVKTMNTGYEAKKAPIFTENQITKFILEAPDQNFLAAKMILIMGVYGALRRGEIYKITINDIKEKEMEAIVKLKDTKTKSVREFKLIGECFNVYKKYASARPQDTEYKNFFLNYQKGKCTNQPIGIHKIGDTPSLVARFLKLPNPNSYTGHTFHRTSLSLISKSYGMDQTTVKKYKGSIKNFAKVAYIEEDKNKIISPKKEVLEHVLEQPSTSVEGTFTAVWLPSFNEENT